MTISMVSATPHFLQTPAPSIRLLPLDGARGFVVRSSTRPDTPGIDRTGCGSRRRASLGRRCRISFSSPTLASRMRTTCTSIPAMVACSPYSPTNHVRMPYDHHRVRSVAWSTSPSMSQGPRSCRLARFARTWHRLHSAGQWLHGLPLSQRSQRPQSGTRVLQVRTPPEGFRAVDVTDEGVRRRGTGTLDRQRARGSAQGTHQCRERVRSSGGQSIGFLMQGPSIRRAFFGRKNDGY